MRYFEIMKSGWGFIGKGFVLPRGGFAGFGDGDEDEGEFGGGDFDFDAGIVMPEAFGFMEFKDAVIADSPDTAVESVSMKYSLLLRRSPV